MKRTKEAAATINIHRVLTPSYDIREEVLNGLPHIVVPVVMMVEGVHAGSHGPIFHKAEELSANPSMWDGVPVTVSHPKINGSFVSANTPEIAEEVKVGVIRNSHYDEGLKAEAWIDLSKIQQNGPEALEDIENGRPLDVSVGVFNETVRSEGDWNGEPYGYEARNYRPDHLALLPDEQGACSWNDGCGIRTNKEGGEMENGDLLKTFKELNEKGFVVSPIVYEKGFRELTQSLQSKLNGMDSAERVYYLQEVYSDHFVYEVMDRERGDSTLYKRNYTVSTNNEVEIAENPVEVRKNVEYIVMSGMRRTKAPISNSNSDNMSEEKKPCCEAKVDALIANKALHWTADDREWLITQEESVIDKMIPKDGPKVAPIEVNAEEVIKTYKATLKTVEDFTSLMPEEMKAKVEGGVKLYKEHRENLVNHILTNTKETWKKEELEALEDGSLEKISKSITNAPADYSGQAGGGAAPEGGVKPMAPFGYKAPSAN